MIFYSNLENKLVFSYNLIYFPPTLLSSLYYLARKYTLICLVLSLHGRGFQKRWEEVKIRGKRPHFPKKTDLTVMYVEGNISSALT